MKEQGKKGKEIQAAVAQPPSGRPRGFTSPYGAPARVLNVFSHRVRCAFSSASLPQQNASSSHSPGVFTRPFVVALVTLLLVATSAPSGAYYHQRPSVAALSAPQIRGHSTIISALLTLRFDAGGMVCPSSSVSGHPVAPSFLGCPGLARIVLPTVRTQFRAGSLPRGPGAVRT